jgi:hypothetical protein
LTIAIVGAACAQPETPAEAPAEEPAPQASTPEWVSLFDGSSLDHFRGYQQEEMPGGWTIEDGAMVASTPGSGNDLVTRDTFTDFELEFEWMVPEAGNSGVMFRVTEEHDYPWMTGPEYQVLDDDHFSDGEPNKNSAASNYDVHVPSVKANRAAGEWNQAKLLVDGAHVEHWLNGQKVVEYDLFTDAWKEVVAGSKWAEMPTYGMEPTGHLAIQGDHTSVSYRNMRIREL